MWQITLLVLDQIIPDWLIKIIFLEGVETAVRSSSESAFGVIGFYEHDWCHFLPFHLKEVIDY